MRVELSELAQTIFICYSLTLQIIIMVAAGALLKSRYPKLFHVTCEPHLLHNGAMKVRSHFQDVDQLIAKVKLVTVKNKTRQVGFATAGHPPHPVFTRWGSWLNVASYYARNLLKVKAMVENFEGLVF